MNANPNKLLFVALLLPLIITLRAGFDSPANPGDESYYNIRIADTIKEQSIITEDDLGSDYKFNLLHYILAFLPLWLKQILPIILGFLTAILFYQLVDKQHNAVSTALLFASPMFLTVFTQITSVMLGTFLAVYGLHLVRRRKMLQLTFVHVFLVLTCFPIWLVMSVYYIFRFKIYPPIIPSLLFIPWVYTLTLAPQQLFTEFGASFGLSVFLFFLALIGFVWRRKNPTRAFFLVVSFIISYFIIELRILFALIIAVYAGRTILKLSNRKWDVPQLKAVTLYLVFLIVVFSAVSSSANLVRMEPSDTEVYNELSELPVGKVLSPSDLGHYVQYFTGNEIVVDGTSSAEQKLLVKELISSQNNMELTNLMIEQGAEYILLPTSEERKGIYFVLDNDPQYFIFYEGEFELWGIK